MTDQLREARRWFRDNEDDPERHCYRSDDGEEVVIYADRSTAERMIEALTATPSSDEAALREAARAVVDRFGDNPMIDPRSEFAGMVAALRATLASPDSLRLDPEDPASVERLARALPAVERALWVRSQAGEHHQVWFDEDVQRHFHEWAEDTAEAIAREWKASALPDPEVTK